MSNEDDYKKLIEKIHSAAKENQLDLSRDEDLSVAIMNLISLEEHMFFTAEKTGKDAYFKILNEIREMRKKLMLKIIKDPEGEVWCMSKHLLASSMRLIEVGTKHLGKGEEKDAKEMFQRAYNLYNLFWALNLKMVDGNTIKSKGIVSSETIQKIGDAERGRMETRNETRVPLTSQPSLVSHPSLSEEKSFFSKIGDALKTAIDCCKE
ncbi:MAG: hypothetical protein AABX17_00135 [Nanoarchaeota archaeon]